MKRRSFAALVTVALLAGCTGTDSPGSPQNEIDAILADTNRVSFEVPGMT